MEKNNELCKNLQKLLLSCNRTVKALKLSLSNFVIRQISSSPSPKDWSSLTLNHRKTPSRVRPFARGAVASTKHIADNVQAVRPRCQFDFEFE